MARSKPGKLLQGAQPNEFSLHGCKRRRLEDIHDFNASRTRPLAPATEEAVDDKQCTHSVDCPVDIRKETEHKRLG